MTLSLIIPTIGRTTLTRAIESAASQLMPGDEIVVVADGARVGAFEQCIKFEHVKYASIEMVGDFGCSACDYGIHISEGTHCFFLGDDDYTMPGAFEAIHNHVSANPHLPHLFAMIHSGNRLGNTIASCAVSGQQIVVPRDFTRLPKMKNFENAHLSDWEFIMNVQNAWLDAGGIQIHDEIIATLEAQNWGKIF